MRTLSRSVGVWWLLAAGLASALAQQPSPDRAAVAKQANEYWQASNVASAMPLYEDLVKQFPQSMLYAERLAFCLIGKASNTRDPTEMQAALKRALEEARRAKSLGDDSNLLHMILDRLTGATPAVPPKASPEAMHELQQAEAAFSKGDLDAALQYYKAAADADPQSYEARLFAGDMYFRKKDVVLAGEWFGKAIALNPNDETAYRYWGDALIGAGQMDQARDKFVDAVVAEPYRRKSWMGLQQWAKRVNVALHKPNVPRPEPPESAVGVWLPYRITREQWRTKPFAESRPTEPQYRHSLQEEADALNAVVRAAKDLAPDKVDASLSGLMRLADARMIEAFVLLQAADAGIAADYPAYRDKHREQLHAYIVQLVLGADLEQPDVGKKTP